MTRAKPDLPLQAGVARLDLSPWQLHLRTGIARMLPETVKRLAPKRLASQCVRISSAYNSRIRNGRNSQWKDVSPWLSEEHEPAYPLIYLPSDNLQFWVRHLDECHSISAYITLFLVACPTSSNILDLFSQSNIMLCGKFDRRRGGHRCMACRRAHKKVCGFLALPHLSPRPVDYSSWC